ncbi:MAG TPA: permease-like cell division protein FtsX [Bacteroidales bacterium]|jgi:cell division transport system permease protein|nr:permease-like cell division protein FtsX [Bacteroidales bacterium]HOX74516.1 permease-like cell division protein FtsX [Bacteroidales bacterium]HPM87622.1 permease-like cell division protein FtsX [Bacteroidales bacterium]HQM70082.1 permease-like cell division protein FtsX [Bacteroidales bacterium]
MKKNEAGFSKTKLRSSYLTLVVSVSLVLFLLGILGLVLINAKGLSDYFRESLSFWVMLDDDAREADIRLLQKDLDAKAYVKSTEYVSKDEAAAKMKDELGEDFISFLGDNPLPPSIDVYLISDYTSPDSVAKIEKYILEYPFVKEVYYQESLLYLINENVNKISLFLLVISLFLFLIALTIINNTIRLSIYSKRFLIRTMQLVGATRSFIRKPFIIQSAFHGFLAALISMILLMGLLYMIEKEFFLMFTFESINLLILLGLAIIITGILINIVSTWFSVNRYLSISEDKLYY